MPSETSNVERLCAKTCSVPILEDGHMVGLTSIDLCPASWDDNGVWVSRIFTPEGHRGKGHARIGMRGLCGAADELKVNLYIAPNSYGPMRNRDLVRWWKRLGFEMRKGSDTTYVRYPKGAA